MTGAADLVAEAARRLAEAGVASPRHDAEVLIALALCTTRSSLRTYAGEPTDDERARALDLIRQRASRVPLQHLTGRVGFRNLELVVGPGVFIPRPETELVAGTAIDELRRLVDSGVVEPLAVDLCTGSGAIAAAIASEVPGCRVVAVEISEAAHSYAIANAAPYGVEVRLGDMASAVADLGGRAHVVAANPPYIPLDAYESVQPEVRDHDPAQALWSGVDGLEAIGRFACVAADLLAPGGLAVCEHADVQGESAPALFGQRGDWMQVRDHPDLAGRARFLTARRARRSGRGSSRLAR